ncbi:MAG: DJ-1/PfpI family protein [Butyrivibrio sp.]|nr:DJ-1/PfpI family protein [Butyrivibrio sp.]
MKLYAFLADGFETVEALGVVDIMRRGGVEVCTVSVSDRLEVVTSHNVTVLADKLFDECDFADADVVFLPGGMPGTKRLEAHEGLCRLIDRAFADGKYIAAICAAPSILGHRGILKGKRATCFPGFEKELEGADVTGEGFCADGKIITGKGMGKTVDFALAILEALTGRDNAEEIKSKIQY